MLFHILFELSVPAPTKSYFKTCCVKNAMSFALSCFNNVDGLKIIFPLYSEGKRQFWNMHAYQIVTWHWQAEESVRLVKGKLCIFVRAKYWLFGNKICKNISTTLYTIIYVRLQFSYQENFYLRVNIPEVKS